MDVVLDSIPQKVSAAMNNNLCRSFGRDEIECALKQMAPDKAPGEDSLSTRFYQQYWHVVGDDISEVCLKVLNEAAELNEINHSLIALIPKIENPQQVTDFRPISLCNVIYKLISKTIVNRMKAVLPEVISQYQSAFVLGRCIHDNVITAFEVIHSIKAKLAGDVPHCVLKLDISKAYDRVEWVFLQGVLQKLGFNAQWVDLIMRCVTSVSFSVLWNGEAVGRITPSRGLRQGDPLSPYLFLMVLEGLTGLFQKADREGLIHGVKAAAEASVISHLLFADDSLLFSRAHLQENKAELSQMLGVPIVECHERYLGLPTTAGRSKKSLFRGIDKRLESHLQGWQSKLLSKAGKFVLVKAMAQAIPVYSINKKDGGLGFRDLEVFNQVLLAKTVWRIVLCLDSMVNKVIRAKYVGNGDWAAAGIVPLCDGSRGDVAVWHFNENGKYSVKSSYWFGMELRRLEEGSSSGSGHDTSNSTNIWSLIWDLLVLNKVKLFLWRAYHAFLPCAEHLFKRKIRSHGGCDRCGDREESVIHSLWYCQVARKLWKCSPWREVHKQWVVYCFADLPSLVAMDGDMEKTVLFVLLCWWLWKDRNEVLHGKRCMDPRKIFEKCMDWQCEIVRVELERKNSLRGSVREREEVSENGEDENNKLSEQVATLFFDGSCDSKAGMAGLGAIIMSGYGNQLGALAFPRTAVLKPHIIEALALWYGLKLSKQVGVSKLTIVGDAVNVIHIIGQSGLDLSDIGGVMDAVCSLKSEFEWISWKHIRKRKNQIVHTLARRALKMDQA
ncbi:hypothetical protein ACLB2K_072993 [Fragaria x ananassa]